MKELLDSPFLYFTVPMAFAAVCVWSFFHVPAALAEGIILLLAPILVLPWMGWAFGYGKLGVVKAFGCISIRGGDRLVLCLFSVLIVALGPVDVIANGFKLADPESYADLSVVGRYVRHISSLCWVLVPVAFFVARGKLAKVVLNLYALVFPVLIVDRNRLLLVFYTLAFCYVVNARRKNLKWKLLFFASIVVFLFSAVGYFRSGDAFAVESSGYRLVDGYFPLRDIFFVLPTLLQQVVLYVAAPMFNFATIHAESFVNPDFLLSQLSPFGRVAFDVYPYSSVLVPRFNVGTEFFPFLTFGGIELVYIAIILMYLSLLISAKYFVCHPNVFALLIFLKISHTVLFMGFAPQFFILLNVGFVVLVLILYFLSVFLGVVCRRSPERFEVRAGEVRG